MYGKSAARFPRRVVCLSAEHVETCDALGVGDRVVGIPGHARRPPEARDTPRVGGFTTFRVDAITGLQPDLVLAFSDLQAEISAELIRAGCAVLCTNPRSLTTCSTRSSSWAARSAWPAGEELVLDMRDETRQVREFSSVWPDRPRVYFEEWPDPLIAGIRWVSELIEMAGGRDVFAELRSARRRPARRRSGRGGAARSRDHPRLVVWQAARGGALTRGPAGTAIAAVRSRAQCPELDGADVLVARTIADARVAAMHEIVQQALAL